MCTATNAAIIEDVVRDWMDEGKSFTAWDVTKEAKARGADESHWHLKQAVHQFFFTGVFSAAGYTRSIVNIASPPPFLYHPVTEDPQDYEDKVLKGQGGSAPTDGVQTTPVSTNNDNDGGNSVTRDVDKDGRLCIPKPFLVDLNLTHGDVVDVFVNHTDIEVCPHNASLQPDAIYSVNKDGRVRISKEVLTSGRTSWQIELCKGAAAGVGIDRIVLK